MKAVSTKSKAMEIFKKSFESPMANKSPRQTAITQFKDRLGMKKTTSSTYYSSCMADVRNQEQSIVTATGNTTPWVVYKTDRTGRVTSFGNFHNLNVAEEFNAKYQHDGVVRGPVVVGQLINK